jgi:hypothetical protein
LTVLSKNRLTLTPTRQILAVDRRSCEDLGHISTCGDRQ